MKSARFSPAIAASVVGALVLGMTGATVFGPVAVDSYAASGTALPIAHFAHLVVDAPHGHLYFSGGTGTDGILVTDLDGGNPTTISGEPGVTGLTLSADGSELYAALPDQDAIAAISTANLTESARYGTGADTHPDSLAVAGGTLWFGYGTTGAGGIGSVDAAGTVSLGEDAGSWPAPPALATTPTPSGVLAAAAQTGDTTAVATYSAEDGELTRQAEKSLPVPELTDFAVTADGEHLALSSWLRASSNRYRVSDLAVDGQFAEPLAARAVAVAPDGTLAGCGCTPGFEAFPETAKGYYNEYEFESGMRLALHGLAWAPDGSRLYAVIVDAAGGTPSLLTARNPETAWVRLSGNSTTTPLAPGEAYSFRADFDAPLSLAAGESIIPGTVRITRYDQADPNGVPVPSPTATPAHPPVDYFGSYAVSGTAPTSGPLSFRVDYSGSGHYGPAAKNFDVPVAKYAPTMTLTAPDTGGRAAPLTVTGRLNWPHAHVKTGAVHVVKTDLAHPSGYSLGTVPVAADGTFALHDTPQTGGANTYSFTYDGGASYLPVTGSQTVQVSRSTPALKVTTGAKTYHSGATVKVTAHLGTTYNSRVVTLSAQPAGKPRTVLKSGKVDAHGNLAASYKVTRNTVFSAAFAGDYRYAPRTVTAGATLTPAVKTQMQYPLKTTRIGSTTYQVFYKSEVTMSFNLHVTPRQSDGCASVSIEHYSSGAWHQDTSQKCVSLYSDGWYGYSRALKHFTSNDRYRVRGLYAPPATGAQTGGAQSGWTYFTVRPGTPK
ncbi:YncE family protein [Streptomyces sp. NPDC001002]